MSKHSIVRKVITATVVSSAIGLSSLVGSVASADRSHPTFTIVKHVDVGAPGTADDRPTEEVAFYYNRIAFNYAATR